MCCPWKNTFCNAIYNACSGAAVGVFIWPLGCPVACPCQWPCPLKRLDFAVCCCISPQSRCKACTICAQQFFVAASQDSQILYPTPWAEVDGKLPPAVTRMDPNNPSELESYNNGTDNPTAKSYPNQFSFIFQQVVEIATSSNFIRKFLNFYSETAIGKGKVARQFASGPSHEDSKVLFGGMWLYPSQFSSLPTPHGQPGPNPAPDEKSAGNRVLLYLHGGAFAVGGPFLYHEIVGQWLCAQTGQVVLIPEIALTGEAGFPAGLQNATETYVNCVKHFGEDNVVVMGDSAGGNLAMTVVMNAAKLYGTPPPAAAILFSPWVDLRDSALFAPSMEENSPLLGGLLDYGHKDILPPNAIPPLAYAYANRKARETDYLISPILAADDPSNPLDSLPPIFITTGGNEILRDQQLLLVEQLKRHWFAGKKQTRYQWYKNKYILSPENFYMAPGMPHVYNVLGVPLVYYTGCCMQASQVDTFEPMIGWEKAFQFLDTIPGFARDAPAQHRVSRVFPGARSTML